MLMNERMRMNFGIQSKRQKRKNILPYIIDFGKDGKGYRGKSADQTYDEDNLVSSFESSHGVGVNRPANGQISLTGEGENCED